MSLESLQKKLEDRVRREVKESEKDLGFATDFLGENPEMRNTSYKLLKGGIWASLIKAGLVIGAVAGLFHLLTLRQFVGLGYLVSGFFIARITEYSYSDVEYWVSIVFWVPIVLYGGIVPDKWRLEK